MPVIRPARFAPWPILHNRNMFPPFVVAGGRVRIASAPMAARTVGQRAPIIVGTLRIKFEFVFHICNLLLGVEFPPGRKSPTMLKGPHNLSAPGGKKFPWLCYKLSHSVFGLLHI